MRTLTAALSSWPPSIAEPFLVSWSPESWKSKHAAQAVSYADPRALEAAVDKLRSLPPLVTSWEVEALKKQLAEAQEGRRLVLQGGDCAETLAECRPEVISNLSGLRARRARHRAKLRRLRAKIERSAAGARRDLRRKARAVRGKLAAERKEIGSLKERISELEQRLG